jgi:hypothetical protein
MEEAMRILFDEILPALPTIDKNQVVDSYYGYLGKNAPAPIVTVSVEELRRATIAKIEAWQSEERITHFDVTLSWRNWIDLDAVSVRPGGSSSGMWSNDRCRSTRFWRTSEQYYGMPIM